VRRRLTEFIFKLVFRGEHLLLFLARTVGRQLSVQDNFVRINSKMRWQQEAVGAPTDQNVPEHDLKPPKFARKAFEHLLGDWSAVRSLLKVGLKDTAEDAVIVEEAFHLGQQHGSTHLDKFTFALLAKCQESVRAYILWHTMKHEILAPGRAP
jgi:E3 ubiquitin-protein ligase EDD1